MTQLIRSVQKETNQFESAKFYGQSLKEVEVQSKERANQLALAEGDTTIYISLTNISK
jgi:hypothetical protein